MLFFCLAITGFAFSLLFTSLFNGIGPCASSYKARKEMLKTLSYHPLNPQLIYELGSGWGGMARALARHYPHARIVGIENSPLPYLFSIFWNLFFPLKNLCYRRKNFLHLSLGEAQLLFTYLCPSLMPKIAEKLRPSQVLLSFTFAHPWLAPTFTYRCQDLYQSPFYFYFL